MTSNDPPGPFGSQAGLPRMSPEQIQKAFTHLDDTAVNNVVGALERARQDAFDHRQFLIKAWAILLEVATDGQDS
jgi:hypothetical protein